MKLYMVRTQNRESGSVKHDLVAAMSEEVARLTCEDDYYFVAWLTDDVNEMCAEVEQEYNGVACVMRTE